MTRRAWRFAAAAGAAAASLIVPAPAGAVPLLEEGDAIELANKLAEATEEQDVCYGWSVQVQDDGGGLSGVEQGSSFGPGRSPYQPECTPFVRFTASVRYTSEASESTDSASYTVESNLPGFDARTLGGLGVSEAGLLGENDDLVIANATALLPALVAEQGLAKPILLEETAGTIPEADRPTNTPGSDRWRTYWPAYAFAGFLLVAGVGWLVLALYLRYMQTHSPDFTLSSLMQED